jgi:tRNA A-37 threonylcarbamoyl transferase component Bud32
MTDPFSRPVRVPYRCGQARGFRYGEIPAVVESALPRWLASGHVEEGEAIKDRRVYRCGQWLVKFTGRSRALKDILRTASAIRIADLHARLLPVPTPAPLVALELRRGLFLERSLLVTEFVEGPTLREAFGRNEPATKALGPFLALLHRHGVFHGDLHPRNAIWTGSEWVLIDLGALRHWFRRIARRRLILDQWAQLAYKLGADERMGECFASYLAAAAVNWNPKASWSEVQRRADRIRRAHAG